MGCGGRFIRMMTPPLSVLLLLWVATACWAGEWRRELQAYEGRTPKVDGDDSDLPDWASAIPDMVPQAATTA